MIVGIGVDIIEISRVTALCQNPSRLPKLFTENELAYAQACGHYDHCLAGNFAAKEAVGKALGTGLAGLRLTDIEVIHNQAKKPEVRLHNVASAKAQALEITNLQLSISHNQSEAMAFCVAESLMF